MDKETTAQTKKAIENLQDITLTCYIEGDYGRSAAAEDILNILERKQAGVAAFVGAANNFALGLPDYLVSRQYAEQETDYDRFTNYMYSADAIQAANPNAYKAGEIGAEAFSLALAGAGIYKAGVRQFGDDALQMIGKNQLQRVGGEVIDAMEGTFEQNFIKALVREETEQRYNKTN